MSMKKKLLFLSSIAFAICFTVNLFAQTAGTLNFTSTIASHSGSYGAKHYVAIWIENNTGTFIKTKNKFGNSHANTHLCQWKAISVSNLTDATTGATLTSYTSPVAMTTWNGTNAAGTQVADGTYKVWIETTWDDATGNCGTLGTDRQYTSLSFIKGPNAVHLTGQVSSVFTMTLDWVPNPTSVETIDESSDISVYPNPSTGIVNIDYKQASEIKISNLIGAVVYEEKISENIAGPRNIDLNKFANGIYFINVLNGEKSSKHKVILNK